MTHWKTETNRSHMKKHVKVGRMTKKEERAFFGHGFPSPVKWNSQPKSEIAQSDNVDEWFD